MRVKPSDEDCEFLPQGRGEGGVMGMKEFEGDEVISEQVTSE